MKDFFPNKPPFILLLLVFVAFFTLNPEAAHASMEIDGASLSIAWVIPFVGMLVSIAICPLIIPEIWEHHFGKIAAAWGLAFLIPYAIVFTPGMALYTFLHSMLTDYVPFILLLFVLFTVSGGICVKGSLAGTPKVNTAIMIVGTFLASWMGTTGAAMLFIRPLMRANEHRKYRVHTVIFFIFLVANAGGCLTPLGDPPLFLGFLRGVPFFWTFTHMMAPMLFICAILLVLYFIADNYFYKREAKEGVEYPDMGTDKLRLEGSRNFILLGCVVASVLMSGSWKPGTGPSIYGIQLEWQNVLRDFLFIAIAAVSMAVTPKETRDDNDFNWGPIKEVAKIFFGIFVSMAPALAILQAGQDGALASLVGLVSTDGVPNNAVYFWVTGVLSSFLDNAPTYLVFFNTAAGNLPADVAAATLTTEMAPTLLAISAGAVFMGANTYIGNAPNFMVKAIADSSGIKMPSFLGYMVWSACILLPIFVIMTFIFF